MKYTAYLSLLVASLLFSSQAAAFDRTNPQLDQRLPSSASTIEIDGDTAIQGRVFDTGGSGVHSVFFIIRNLATNGWVDVDGSVDSERVARTARLSRIGNNFAFWTIDTSLPAGSYRLYVSAKDNDNNTTWWDVKTTINHPRSGGSINDEILPTISLNQPGSNPTSSRQFGGSAKDEGGAGLRDVFYLIRNTATGNFVSPAGVAEEPRITRKAELSLDDANQGSWKFDTTLPDDQYKIYVGVSDNNGNVNYWSIRATFDLENGGGTPEPGESVFVASDSDIVDPADYYQRDGYETTNVVRMDVTTRTTAGVCTPDDQSGCTLADVIADTDADDAFKVDIAVTLKTNGVIDTGELPNAGFRQRGATSRDAPQKSFRVRLEDDLWRNEERLQLNKSPYDQSRMSNKLAFDLMQQLPHLPSLRTQFVNLWIDDGAGPVDKGLFTHVESTAKEYLINRGLDKDDNLYKANFFSFSTSDLAAIQVDAAGEPLNEVAFEERIEIERGKDHTKLVEMVAAINNPNIPFATVLDKYFNHNNVLMWVTANLLLGQTDAIDQNFLLYNQAGTDKFYFLPWDYDGALRVEQPLTDGNSIDELRERLTFGYAGAANNDFLRQFYLLPGAHDKIVRAATEVRQDYLTDDLIRNLSGQYANAIRPFVSRSPDIENIGGVRFPENMEVWEQRWQSYPSVVASNFEQLKSSPNMPLPHSLKLPFSRQGNTVLWWERATDITGGEITYDIAISSQPDFADGTIIYQQSGIPNQPERVELELNSQSLPSGTWYYRVRAYTGSYFQVANNQVNEGGVRYPGIRQIVVP